MSPFINKPAQLPLKKFCHFIFLYILLSANSYGQIGGNNTFEFLNLVPSPRAAALGGNAIATRADDVSLVWQNPSQLSMGMNKQLQLTYVDYFEGINFGQVAYAQNINRFGMAAATLHYIDYGTFKMTDVSANDLGSFKAAEYALGLSWSKTLDSVLFIGASLKGIYSKLETYSSTGIAADLGMTYLSKDRFFCAALVAKNIGRQFNAYEDAGNEPLPFEMQIGITKQLPKAPFRFGVTWQHLEQFDLTYVDPNIPAVDPLTGESNSTSISFGKKCMRHLVLNTELLFSKSFNLRFGYNFQRRAELTNANKRGTVGFSAGFGFKISKFQLNYARAQYHLGAASNQVSVTVKLSDF